MSTRDVRLVAFDMDGTLLNEASEMTQATREACQQLQAEGCRLVIASGRTYKSAQSPIDGFLFDGYVCSNGAAIYEQDGRLVTCTTLDPLMIVRAVVKIRERPIYYELHDIGSNRLMVKEDRDRVESLLDSADLTTREHLLRHFSFYKLTQAVEMDDLFDRITRGQSQITKLFIWHSQPTELAWVREQLQPFEGEATITSSGIYNVEVIPAGVSKWKGLQYFLEKWQISAEQAAAFGDADNDREILSQVGHSVAMGNAPDDLKAICRYVAGHHDEDGVAGFIRKNLLGTT
ncbi:HAD family hydrolase [Brevibacillus humidisoli]|uniref:HAD family hydrolase n=1 Tax=Brevibacillus humidisoli TaxID=2895522 RepID=UPI001E540D62|nr:HAD family hydrolase [Brevibacillus humidisoli]UFJ40559.1 HAD family hydrolase [Brevibacillus humidisoli]